MRRVMPVIITLSGRKAMMEGVLVVPIRHIRGFLREVHQLSYETYNFKPICNPSQKRVGGRNDKDE